MVCVLASGACEKSRSTLGGDDVEQLRHLPGDNLALVGGNYMKLQNFMQSSIGKMVAQMGVDASGSQSMTKWMACWAKYPELRLVGAVGHHPGGIDVRLVFTGMTIENVTACANEATFTAKADPDGKYLSISIPATTITIDQGYLKLDNGALYMRQSMTLVPVPAIAPSTRADLEADLAAAAKGPTAADDKALLQLANKVDRARTFWFAGTGAGTSKETTLGDIYGTVDVEGGITVDLTAQIKDAALADKIEKGVGEIKKVADKMPPELKSAIEDLKLDRDGDKLHFGAKITDDQLAALVKLGGMARFGGGGAGKL